MAGDSITAQHLHTNYFEAFWRSARQATDIDLSRTRAVEPKLLRAFVDYAERGLHCQGQRVLNWLEIEGISRFSAFRGHISR